MSKVPPLILYECVKLRVCISFNVIHILQSLKWNFNLGSKKKSHDILVDMEAAALAKSSF